MTDTLSNKAAEIATPCLDAVLEYHETGGHRGDGSDAALCAARSELVALRSAASSNKVVDTQEITDELIAGIGRGEIWAQGKAMDVLTTLRASTQCSGDTQELADELERMAGINANAPHHAALLAGATALRTTHSPSEAEAGVIRCWTHEIRDPDCPKCRSETAPSLPSDKTVELLSEAWAMLRDYMHAAGEPDDEDADLLFRIGSHRGEMK